MINLVKFCTVTSAVGVIAAAGGVETGMYGWGGALVRMAIFSLLTVMFRKLEKVVIKRKRAKRKAILKAQRNK